jgi:hypothetical protein
MNAITEEPDMRALIIGPDEQAAIRKVVDYATDHCFTPDANWVPGDQPDHVVRVPDGYRCVFTLTKRDGKLFRHLSISVSGPLFPSPEACIMLAKEFGFTASDDSFNLPMRAQDGWGIAPNKNDHCVVLWQEEMTRDIRYVECDDHGPRRHAYIVCKHLIESQDRSQVAHHRPWSDAHDGMGELVCSIPVERHGLKDLKVVCEDHLIDLGLLETRLT